MIANAYAMPAWGAVTNAYAMPRWGAVVPFVGSTAPPSHFGALPPLVNLLGFGAERLTEAEVAEYERLRAIPENKLSNKQKLRVNAILGKGLFKMRDYSTDPGALCPAVATVYVPKEAINIADLLGKPDGSVMAYERWAIANPCSGPLQRTAAKTYFNTQFRRYGGSAQQSVYDAYTGKSVGVDPLTGATVTDAGGTSVDSALAALMGQQSQTGLDAGGETGASPIPWPLILGGVALLGGLALVTQRKGKKKKGKRSED